MQLYALGVTDDAIERIAQVVHLEAVHSSLEPPPSPGDGFIIASNADLEDLLKYRPKLIIEEGGNLGFGLDLTGLKDSCLILSFTAKTAYGMDLALFVSRCLAEMDIQFKHPDEVELVLTEVISNGILHGNFGIPSIDKGSLEGLIHFQNMVDMSLKDPVIGNKRIVLSFQIEGQDIMVQVRDEGVWIEAEKQKDNPFGRGHALMEAYTSSFFIDKATSTTSVTFKFLRDDANTGNRSIQSLHEENDERVFVYRDIKTTVKDKYIDSLKDASILVVDDMAFNRQVIGAILKAAGYKNLTFAVDGVDALEKVQAQTPDLMILDLMMPRMDGYEVCRNIRSNPDWAQVPILVQTGLDNANERNQAFTFGATDLVTKPINRLELLSRVEIHLENSALMGALRTYQERLKHELEAATRLQQNIFPSSETVRHHEKKFGVKLQALFKPSSELTGDMWGFLNDDQDRLGCFVADFSGHGLAAAVNTFRLDSILRNLRHKHAPNQVLEDANYRLQPSMQPGTYATMFYGILDPEKQEIIYAAAGATAPLIRLPDGRIIEADPAGVPIGLIIDARYDLRRMPFPKGSTLFLYSDALTDNLCSDDDLTPLKKIIETATSPKDLTHKMFEAFKKSGMLVDDDLTLFAIAT